MKKVIIGLIVILAGLFFIGFCSISPPRYNSEMISQMPIQQKETVLTAKGQKIKAKHPFWSDLICNDVAGGYVRIGMTTDQARTAWGRPYRINTTMGARDKHEQWVMSDSINSQYLYFDNGILTVIQDSR